MESTYGDRDHESVAAAREHLARVVRETAARGGRVLIPAFAVGRAQELVYDLHVLARAGAIPAIPIVIDSPLATAATEVFENNADLLDRTEAPVREIARLFRFDSMSYTSSTEESKALNDRAGPLIIIAGSGMAEGGRILHHLKNGASNPRNTVLIVGFQAACWATTSSFAPRWRFSTATVRTPIEPSSRAGSVPFVPRRHGWDACASCTVNRRHRPRCRAPSRPTAIT
jgi:metallo-beta-lactamase family protein